MTASDRDKIIEVMARGVATGHYMRRFQTSADDPQVVANVNANWWTWSKECWDAYSHLQASGMAVVPVEPSDKMLAGACRTHIPGVHMSATNREECPRISTRRRIWQAMLAASPYGKAVVKEDTDHG